MKYSKIPLSHNIAQKADSDVRCGLSILLFETCLCIWILQILLHLDIECFGNSKVYDTQEPSLTIREDFVYSMSLLDCVSTIVLQSKFIVAKQVT